MSDIIISNDLTPGEIIDQDGTLLQVIDTLQNKTAMRKMVVKVKVKDIRTGTIRDITFGGGDKVTLAYLEKKKMNYSYNDGSFFVFMDAETYEQVSIPKERMADQAKFLTDNLEVEITYYKGEIMGIELPVKVALTVTHTEDAVRGDTINKPQKDATLETGYVIKVPMFVKIGDKVYVRTDTGEYDSRAN
ncbi:MAG: elongation factor P [Bacilli bacterium]|jgi:elongation factor P|nr:elongation factor P [Bacilli bacterium]